MSSKPGWPQRTGATTTCVSAPASRSGRVGGEPVDSELLERLVARMRYAGGDFADDSTYGKLATALGSARQPVFYLEIPPSLFETAVSGLASADLTERARVVVEKPALGARPAPTLWQHASEDGATRG